MGFIKQAIFVAITAIAITTAPSFFKKSLSIPEVKGYVAPGFERVKDKFRENFELGWDKRESGTAFAAYYEGIKVVDLWAGFSDDEAGIEWKQDTLGIIYSVSKAIAAVSMAILAEQGYVDFEKPVAHYWPEYAQHGKEKTTVAMVLEHEAGLPVFAEPQTWDMLKNPEKLDAVIAASTPLWEPGTAHGYHGITYGFILNAISRRVDPKGRTVGKIFEDEVAKPHGIDVYIGVPVELSYRVARAVPVKQGILDMLYMMYHYPPSRRFMTEFLLSAKKHNLTSILQHCGEICDFNKMVDAEYRKLEIPSANGFGSAEGLAKLFGILANGGTNIENNKTIISQKFLNSYEDDDKPRTYDYVVQHVSSNRKYGMYIEPETQQKGRKNCYGHPGAGGQMGLADPINKLGFGFVSRYMTSSFGYDLRFKGPRDATVEAVKALRNYDSQRYDEANRFSTNKGDELCIWFQTSLCQARPERQPKQIVVIQMLHATG